MISNYLIPLTNVPQIFEISLAGVNYTLTVKWNDADEAGWVLDIGDASQNPIVCGIPFTTGADLLDELAYFGIGGKLVVYTNGDESAVPTLDNLGLDCNLYFQTDVLNNGS